MFSKPHFNYCALTPIHTKIAYKNYVLRIAYSKLISFDSSPLNEGTRKLSTFLKERPLSIHLKTKKKTLTILIYPI